MCEGVGDRPRVGVEELNRGAPRPRGHQRPLSRSRVEPAQGATIVPSGSLDLEIGAGPEDLVRKNMGTSAFDRVTMIIGGFLHFQGGNRSRRGEHIQLPLHRRKDLRREPPWT